MRWQRVVAWAILAALAVGTYGLMVAVAGWQLLPLTVSLAVLLWAVNEVMADDVTGDMLNGGGGGEK